MPQTERGKAIAIVELQIRRANKPEKVNNSSLPAGAPMVFYCIACGHVSATMPEDYLCLPPKLCVECQALKELGWLDV